jgi:hypothetical protein
MAYACVALVAVQSRTSGRSGLHQEWCTRGKGPSCPAELQPDVAVTVCCNVYTQHVAYIGEARPLLSSSVVAVTVYSPCHQRTAFQKCSMPTIIVSMLCFSASLMSS